MQTRFSLPGGGRARIKTAQRGLGMFLAIVLLACVGLLGIGCQSRSTATGYWEGKGTAVETPMKDQVRELRRSGDFEFWFVIANDGSASGEAEIVYDAVLTVENLPQVNLGIVSFNPEVGGKVTDLDPRRRFPIEGRFDREEMVVALRIATKEEERKPIEFTFRADPGVGVSMHGIGGSGGGAERKVEKMDMTPFEVFGCKASVEKRPDGRFAARCEEKGENYVIQWNARQMDDQRRRVE